MLQIIVAAVAVLAVVLLALLGARSVSAQAREGQPGSTPAPVVAQAEPSVAPAEPPAPPTAPGKTSPGAKPEATATPPPRPPGPARAKLVERLRKLSETPPPSKLAVGAMCYEPMMAPGRVEYVCPKCGKRTVYAITEPAAGPEARQADPGTGWHLQEVAEARRLVGEIKGLDVRLDESELCRACSPAASEPRMAIIVRHPNGKGPHRFRGVSTDDLRLLAEFMEGKTKHRLSNDGERPMKEYIMRLQKLLGVPLHPDAPAKPAAP